MAVRRKIKTTAIRYSLFLKDLYVLTYSSVAITAVKKQKKKELQGRSLKPKLSASKPI
jgi:hypothetical protein